MKNLLVIIAPALAMILLLGSCTDQEFRESKIMAGGEIVSAKTLSTGKNIYQEYCMACHGVEGKGDGVASKGLATPPRNFALGIIKFGDVVAGELTHDEAIVRTLQKGLNGTAMLPWDLSERQMHAVIQYIKTFAPDTWVGKDKKLGKKITVTKDPYKLARKGSAISRGRDVYHGVAQCQSCHMAYVSHAELSDINQRINGEPITSFETDLYKMKPQDSEHSYATIPPDFTWDGIRSAASLEELYIRLAAGIGGTAMPAWKDVLEDEDIWAVSYYVKSLMELKNKPERAKLMGELNRK